MLDNVLDAADVRTQNFFDSLRPITYRIKTANKTVRATHQITEVHLVRKQTLHYHKNSFCIPVMALVIYSHLKSANLSGNHTTNVVQISDSRKSDGNVHSEKTEKAVYVLNSNEVVNTIRSGAYNHAEAWDKALNDSIDGMEYERPTNVSVKTAYIYGQKAVDLQGYHHNPKRPKITATIVQGDINTPYFAASTTDNDFTFMYADTLNQLYKTNQADDDGFRIDKAIVEDEQNLHQGLTDMGSKVDSLFVGGHLDMRKLKSEIQKSRLHKNKKADSSIVNPGDLVKLKQNRKKARQLSAEKDHISKNAQDIRHPLSMKMKKPQTSQKSDIDKQKSVTTKAQSIGNEMSLRKPLDANGKPQLKNPKKKLNKGRNLNTGLNP